MWRLGILYLIVAVVFALISAGLPRGPWEMLTAITSGFFFVMAIISFIAWILSRDQRRVRVPR